MLGDDDTLRRLAVTIALVALAASACGGSPGEDPPASSSPAAPSASSTPTAQAEAVPSSPAPASPSPSESVAGEPVILAGGLGIASFGDPADTVIAALGARFGQPTGDTGWVEELPDYGDCQGTLREVTWGAVRAGFLDGPSPYAPGGPHFVNYQVGLEGAGQEGPRTPEGIGLGSTVEELQAAYPDRLEIVTESDRGVAFRILSTDPAMPDARITGLSARESGVIALSSGYICF